jgi:hypothetical protein
LVSLDGSGDAARLPKGGDGAFLRPKASSPTGVDLEWEDGDTIAGIGYTIIFGARFPALSARGRYHHAHGEASSSNATSVDETASLTVAKDATITRMAYRTESADNTTQYHIVVLSSVGVVQTSTQVDLTAQNGVVTGLSIALLAGQQIAVRYGFDDGEGTVTGGTPPGGSTVDVFCD